MVVHVIAPSVTRDPDFVPLFASRAPQLLALSHANLTRTLDLVAEGQRCHWVSEFIQGHTLASVLAKQKDGQRALTFRQHLTILCEVLRGLEHAHRSVDASGAPSPLVYRHLSPSSVLVSYDGKVKLTDPAMCAVPPTAFGRFEGEAERLAYQAPESCLGRVGDPRSDIYAVGALLWEAVCGRSRPVGASIEEALEMCRAAAEPEFDAPGDGPLSPLVAITRRALAKDPAERHASARELRLELEAHMPPVPASRDRGSLFAFMCNHFCEEHDALQRLLESRAPGLLAAAKRLEVGADAGAFALASPPPFGATLAGFSPSRRSRRLAAGAGVLALSGAVALTFALLRPEPAPRVSETQVEQLRPAPPPPRPLVITPPPASEPAPARAPSAAPPRSAPAPSRAHPAPARGRAPAAARSSANAAAQGAPRFRSKSGAAARDARPSGSASGSDGRARPGPGAGFELAPRVTPESASDEGVDLRALERRAPRQIDKNDPYARER